MHSVQFKPPILFGSQKSPSTPQGKALGSAFGVKLQVLPAIKKRKLTLPAAFMTLMSLTAAISPSTRAQTHVTPQPADVDTYQLCTYSPAPPKTQCAPVLKIENPQMMLGVLREDKVNGVSYWFNSDGLRFQYVKHSQDPPRPFTPAEIKAIEAKTAH
jgi:hypothetical protein